MNKISKLKLIDKKYEILNSFGTGGSSAETLLVKDRENGIKYILKFSTWDGVGSSGIPWLKTQAKRLIELKNLKAPELKNKIPVVYKIFSSKNLYYYAMDYFENSLPVSLYYFNNPRIKLDNFILDIKEIIKLMCVLYSKGWTTPPKNMIYNAHVLRIKKRTKLLTQRKGPTYENVIKNRQIKFSGKYVFRDLTYLFNELFESKKIMINNKAYLNSNFILPIINNDKVINMLTPEYIPLYYHGDSTLRNFLRCPDGSIRMIDVRGLDLPKNTVSIIDVAYEMGKLMRTFFLEIIRSNNFTIRMIKKEPQFSFSFELKETKSVKNFLEIHEKFSNILEKCMKNNRILASEKGLIKRTHFAEASHFLADAVNRMESDPSGMQTLAYYFLGLELFDIFLKGEKLI